MAIRHDLMTTDEHFEAAIRGDGAGENPESACFLQQAACNLKFGEFCILSTTKAMSAGIHPRTSHAMGPYLDRERKSMGLSDAKEKIEACRKDCNEARPHESLGYLAPSEFVRTSQATRRPERV
ncbi:MAG: transposase [Phycisphaerales bacterium]|nr:transposase [Phycisphaerales bacterium]